MGWRSEGCRRPGLHERGVPCLGSLRLGTIGPRDKVVGLRRKPVRTNRDRLGIMIAVQLADVKAGRAQSCAVYILGRYIRDRDPHVGLLNYALKHVKNTAIYTSAYKNNKPKVARLNSG
jgi:hypothetical protein